MPNVLLVDDEPNLRAMLAALLARGGHVVTEAGSVARGREALSSARFDVLIVDHRLGDGDGQQLLAHAIEGDPELPVIMLTAYATADLAVAAMAAGAFDFITKPFVPDMVLAAVRRACTHGALARENARLKVRVGGAGSMADLIGDSPPMGVVREMIARVAPTQARVLILGETGTGKELVARAIHAASPRRDEPYVAVNCASLAESLLESELFGHARGAFTGADSTRQGMFEQANGGTLLLDEAGEMSLGLQAKLLRVLEDGVVRRVGGGQSQVDVRVIAATHRDLRSLVAAGKFRDDLYQRLSVFPIHLPPLRERREDLPLLVQHFLLRAALELRMRPSSITPGALAALKEYRFPGNVRELRNLMERAYILAGGADLATEHFPLAVGTASDNTNRSNTDSSIATQPNGNQTDASSSSRDQHVATMESWLAALPESVDLRATLESAERALVKRALEASGGNQTRAAQLLHISRPDLAYKLKKWEAQ